MTRIFALFLVLAAAACAPVVPPDPSEYAFSVKVDAPLSYSDTRLRKATQVVADRHCGGVPARYVARVTQPGSQTSVFKYICN